MTPKSEANGNHHGHIRSFKLPDNHIAFVPCPSNIDKKRCYKDINVIKGDHCMKTRAMECEDGHAYYVWHNPETKTFMVTCN